MTKRVKVPAEVTLEYWSGKDIPGRKYVNFPVDPEFTAELTLSISDDSEADPRVRVLGGRRPQVNFEGTPRALEAFGKYLIALARVNTANPNLHMHFEDVRDAYGDTAHLIVRRVGTP
jgi:hypothetical protein